MNIKMGDRVKSKRAPSTGYGPRLEGEVVGFGAIQWPLNIDDGPGDETPHPVYLVKIARGSTSLGPSCLVMRADQVELVPPADVVRVRAEIAATLLLPPDLELALRGGPDGNEDNKDAYTRLEMDLADRAIPMQDVSVSSLEP
jgi:hypothetical protein